MISTINKQESVLIKNKLVHLFSQHKNIVLENLNAYKNYTFQNNLKKVSYCNTLSDFI